MKGVEEETVSSSGQRRRRRGETLQEHGDPVRVSSAGSQVYSQLFLRLCDEERVGVSFHQEIFYPISSYMHCYCY